MQGKCEGRNAKAEVRAGHRAKYGGGEGGSGKFDAEDLTELPNIYTKMGTCWVTFVQRKHSITNPLSCYIICDQ
jgi:hypothetical protein